MWMHLLEKFNCVGNASFMFLFCFPQTYELVKCEAALKYRKDL